MNDLVSVITIFRNEERFLAEAVASVFAQQYDNWELLLVDDGSTDASTEIARDLARKNPDRVRYLEHPGHSNRGMSATRNLGLSKARGEFIALLDADDIWLPEKLQNQISLLKAHPSVGMVFGASRYWYGWTGEAADVALDKEVGLSLPGPTLFQPPELSLLLYPLGKEPAPCPSDLMFRAEVARRVDGFEEHFTGAAQMYEDQAFLAKVYLGTEVLATSECLSLYRRHPDSCVASVIREGQYDHVREYFLNWFYSYLKMRGIDNYRIWKRLKAAVWRYRHPALHAMRLRAIRYLRPRSWYVLARKIISANGSSSRARQSTVD